VRRLYRKSKNVFIYKICIKRIKYEYYKDKSYLYFLIYFLNNLILSYIFFMRNIYINLNNLFLIYILLLICFKRKYIISVLIAREKSLKILS